MDSSSMSLAALEKKLDYFSSSEYFTSMATAVSKIMAGRVRNYFKTYYS